MTFEIQKGILDKFVWGQEPFLVYDGGGSARVDILLGGGLAKVDKVGQGGGSPKTLILGGRPFWMVPNGNANVT